MKIQSMWCCHLFDDDMHGGEAECSMLVALHDVCVRSSKISNALCSFISFYDLDRESNGLKIFHGRLKLEQHKLKKFYLFGSLSLTVALSFFDISSIVTATAVAAFLSLALDLRKSPEGTNRGRGPQSTNSEERKRNDGMGICFSTQSYYTLKKSFLGTVLLHLFLSS